jgi:hypothetical protein
VQNFELISREIEYTKISFNFFVFGHRTKFKLLVTFKLQKMIMILPESVSVGHSDQGNSYLFHISVQVTFYVNRDS